MINNRQNGRRRGRGGQRPQGNPGQPGGGNRIDNRARGNAQQLHEKYKNLARDSQLAGDRVTTEYYLQFADHYFRVLNENRARFEDQRPRQREDGDEEFEGEDEFEARDNRDQNQRRDRGDYRRDRDDSRPERQPEAAQAENDGGADEQQGEERQVRARRPRRRRDEFEGGSDEPQTLAPDFLPPAIGVVEEPAGEEAQAPRRRGRRPRTEAANDPVEVPPAA